MAIKNENLDELLKYKDPKTIFSSEGSVGELKEALAERLLNAEMDPRDRSGSFEPQLIAEYQRRILGFDDNIISMFARCAEHSGDPGLFARSDPMFE
jgi:putative transposase